MSNRFRRAMATGDAADNHAYDKWDGLTPPYRTIVADPPWQYETTDRRDRDGGWILQRPLSYSGMPVEAIQALPVGALADDARLFLWITNRYLRHGWDVLEAWGFTPQDRVLVWCKDPRGTVNVTTEFVLVGRKGNPRRMPWYGTTWFNWQRLGHSVKPGAFYDLVESWCEPPFVDLFARQTRFGWDSWGYGVEASA